MFEDVNDCEIDGHIVGVHYDGFVVDGAEVEHGDD